MTIDEQIGKRIKTRRLQLHMSQEELAIKTGLSRTYIYYVETGKKSLTIKTLSGIREALKVNFTYFFQSSSDGMIAKS